jgi:enamidase
MHDIKAIRDNPEAFDHGLARRGLKPLAAQLIALDAAKRDHVQKLQEAQSRRNALSKDVGDAMKAGDKAKQMVAWARKYGIQSTIHTGGPSIPGSGLIDKDVVLEADADIIGHINGGHTALPDDQIVCLCESCKRGIEIVHNGNERAGLLAMRTAFELKQPERVILGTDAPAGSGVQPLGILRMIAMLSSLGNVPAEIAFCFATGNTARMRGLDCGTLEAGKSADFVLIDRAQHAPGKTMLESIEQGNLPGVGMTVIDGIVRSQRSRNTPPAEKIPELVKAPPAAAGAGH